MIKFSEIPVGCHFVIYVDEWVMDYTDEDCDAYIKMPRKKKAFKRDSQGARYSMQQEGDPYGDLNNVERFVEIPPNTLVHTL